MKTQLQENMRLQEYASSQLKDAEAAIHAVQIELGSIPNNTVEEYNKAADYFNKECMNRLMELLHRLSWNVMTI